MFTRWRCPTSSARRSSWSSADLLYSGLRRQSHGLQEGTYATSVRQDTLDHIVGDRSDIGLVKLDVEGAELGVFLGGKSLPTKSSSHGIRAWARRPEQPRHPPGPGVRLL